MEGILSKWTNIVNGWQTRWFVLDFDDAQLNYYLSKDKKLRGERRGYLKLANSQVSVDIEDKSVFHIKIDNKTYYFQAKDQIESRKWIEAVETCQKVHSSGNFSSLIINDNMPQNRDEAIKKFDFMLSEADSYLQLLLNYQINLEKKLLNDREFELQDLYNNLLLRISNTSELVKQAIVSLQKAKYTCLNNEFLHDFPMSSELENTLIPSSSKLFSNGHSFSVSQPTLVSSSELTSSTVTINNNNNIINNNETSSKNQQTQHFSYSSEEDEDREEEDDNLSNEEFFDTKSDLNEEMYPSHYPFDELYDEINEQNIGDVQEQHGSVIRYLLGQLRIGMDLTRITLPTFILEKRSTLEMYADFLAHPDLWLAIGSADSPEQRMVACVRWYLSAFHSSRRSSVPKKPYNPVLGEIFQCFWRLPKSDNNSTLHVSAFPNSSATSHENDKNKPVAWALNDDVCFISEQVSHHPPISAFYAEHKQSRMQVNGHIWTRSRFLGLSICAELVGQTQISLLDRNEHYFFSFPTGYGRNILGVPWLELGGKVQVTCPKTGYSCNVDFKTKPFYGGKRDQIKAEIFRPSERSPFLTIEGEWNNKMWCKRGTSQNSELFVDTKSLPIMRKLVRPRGEQAETESRRLWQDLTFHLRNGDIDAATAAKHAVEMRQRELARNREASNLTWTPVYFEQLPNQLSVNANPVTPSPISNYSPGVSGNSESSWFYRWPLGKRFPPKKTDD